MARIGVSSSRASVAGDPRLDRGRAHARPAGSTPRHFWRRRRWFRDSFGNGGRNILIGPGFSQWDIALLKNVRFTRRWTFSSAPSRSIRWNHAAFTGINTTVRFDAAGKPTQSYGAVTSSGPGRILSFGLKLLF